MMSEEEMFRMAARYSLQDPSILRILVDRVEGDDLDSLFTIIDVSMSEKGPDGLRLVLSVLKDKEMCLNHLFIDEMIRYIRNGNYNILPGDNGPDDEYAMKVADDIEEMVDLFEAYPYRDDMDDIDE